MHTIAIATRRRNELLDITDEVAGVIQKHTITSGVCVVFCPHTTAGLTINENADPDVRKDIMEHFNEAVPEQKGYHHREGNADAHIKGSVFGSSLTLIIEKGRLVLGTWQGIYFCECDGPRSRTVYIKVIPD